MKRKIIQKIGTGLLAAVLLAGSCKEPEPIPPRGAYDGGYFVLNEGQFLQGNASLSFIKEDFSATEDSVFYKNNDQTPLGDVAQSMMTHKDKLYLLINNSDKIIVADRWNMKYKSMMDAYIVKPRYMVKVSDRYAVVSNWGEMFDANWADVEDDYLAWVDMDNDVVTDTLHTDLGPNQMVFVGGYVFVSISGVGASRNKVSVIDPAAKRLVADIQVGDRPADIVKDNDDKVWVICSGNGAWTGNETAGRLLRIDPSTFQVVLDLPFQPSEHPAHMVYDTGGDRLFYILNNAVYEMPASATALPAQAFIDLSGDVTMPYGLYYHDGYLFVTDAKDFTTSGTVTVFDANSGSKVGSFEAGFIPNNVLFNKAE